MNVVQKEMNKSFTRNVKMTTIDKKANGLFEKYFDKRYLLSIFNTTTASSILINIATKIGSK